MKVIEQSHEIMSLPDNCLETIEAAGRTCYKSEDRITKESAPKFVKMLIRHKHHAMIEFSDITVRFITNRGVTHELVRHRCGTSFAQESTRYVRYDGGAMVFIRPDWVSTNVIGEWLLNDLPDGLTEAEKLWMIHRRQDEVEYNALKALGWRAEQARDGLPNALKTEIVVKANIREWRHIFSLRCAPAAHPQMVALMKPLLAELKTRLPVVFDDLGV